MKKILLTLVAAATVTAGSAQDLQSIKNARNEARHTTEFSVAAKMPLSATKMSATKSRRAQKDGVFYARPEGTYWITGYQDQNTTYEYLVVPPFTDLKFPNLCAVKDQATWTYGKSDLKDYVDENNDLIFSFDKPSYGYVSFAPAINVENTSYKVADYVLTMDSVPMMLQPINYVKCHRYYGFQDGSSPFMSGIDSFDFDEDGQPESFKTWGLRQYFEKPATPLYLHEVSVWATTKNKNLTGEKLKAVFNKVVRDKDGHKTVGEEITTMDCTVSVDNEELAAGSGLYPCDLIFACQKADEFGTLTAVPVLLSEEFAITISGLNEDGVDIRTYFADQGEYDEEFATYASPTYIMPADLNGNHIEMKNGNGLSYYGSSKGENYCYNTVFMFYGEMDGMTVVAATNQLLVGEEGGEALAMVEGVDGGVEAYVYTNYPMFIEEDGQLVFSGNYDFDGIPEWAQMNINNAYYEYGRGTDNETRGLHQIWFNVEPLPQGEKGRLAIVTVKSAFGFTAKEPIFILQGDAEVPTGVKTIKFDAQGKFVGTYNMNGQRVNNQKGLVISNGKKVIKK